MRWRLGGTGSLATPSAEGRYDAFLSYSHATDGRLAPALEKGLQRFAKPWYRMRALRIFRDETGLSANPHLWSSIAEALDESQHFVLLASPEAAQSPWVEREVEHWCAGKSPASILIAVTDGEAHWDAASRDFDWQRTTALPAALRGRFGEEPRWADLRWARTADDLSLSHPAFRNAIAELAAPLHGRPKDELASEEVRQHRRTLRIARSAAALLALLTAASIAGGLLAVAARNETQHQLDVAESQAIAGQARVDFKSQLSRGLLLALEAYSISPTIQARASLVQGLEAASHIVRFVRLPPEPAGTLLPVAAFSPDDKTLAIGSGGQLELRNTIVRFDVATGRRVGRPLSAPYGAAGLAYSPNGAVLAVANCPALLQTRFVPMVVVRLRLSTGRRVGPTLHNGLATDCQHDFGHIALEFGSGGRTLVAADARGDVTRWDVATGRLSSARGRNADPAASGAAISPSGREIATGGNEVTVWDSASGSPIVRPVRSFDRKNVTMATAFAPNGSVVAALDDVGTVTRWDSATGREVGTPLRAGNGNAPKPYTSMTFSPNGKLLAVGDISGTVTIFDLAHSELAHVRPVARARSSPRACSSPKNGHVSVVGCAQCGSQCVYTYSPDRQTVAVGDSSGDVYLWSALTRRRVRQLWLRYQSTEALAFSPDGKTLAVMSSLGAPAPQNMTLWDVSTGTELGTPLVAPSGRAGGVTFGRDGQSVTAYSIPAGGLPGGTVTWRPLPVGGGIGAVRSRICSLVGRNLTKPAWKEFVPDRPYRKLCPQWP